VIVVEDKILQFVTAFFESYQLEEADESLVELPHTSLDILRKI